MRTVNKGRKLFLFINGVSAATSPIILDLLWLWSKAFKEILDHMLILIYQ